MCAACCCYFPSTDRFHVRYGEIGSVRVPDQHEPWEVAAGGVREEIKSNIGPMGGHGRCGSALGSLPRSFLHFGKRACAQDMRRTGRGTRRASHRRVPRVPAWSFVVLLDGVLERGLPVPRVRRLEEGKSRIRPFWRF